MMEASLINQEIVCLARQIRDFEIETLKLYREGKIKGSIHLCIGQELQEAYIINHLKDGDILCSNHRGHGHYLAFTKDFQGLRDELLGLPSGCCQGRGGSQHLHNKNFYSTGIQGGLTPIACGLALSMKWENDKKIVCVFIGDGTLGQGVLYESLNIASLWKLPLLIIIENNHYAMSSNINDMVSGNISMRFTAFGFTKTDFGGDWRKKLPSFHIIDTFRICGHSANDKQLYRSRDELDSCILDDDLKGYRLNELRRLL